MNISIKTLSIFLSELAIEWSNGDKHLIKTEQIRRACPCAYCSGEKDALGNIYSGPEQKYLSSSFHILKYETIGRYGVRFFWKDGHHDGIYTFSLLFSLQHEK